MIHIICSKIQRVVRHCAGTLHLIQQAGWRVKQLAAFLLRKSSMSYGVQASINCSQCADQQEYRQKRRYWGICWICEAWLSHILTLWGGWFQSWKDGHSFAWLCLFWYVGQPQADPRLCFSLVQSALALCTLVRKISFCWSLTALEHTISFWEQRSVGQNHGYFLLKGSEEKQGKTPFHLSDIIFSGRVKALILKKRTIWKARVMSNSESK